MAQDKQLYFIAIIPPEPIYSQVMDYKHMFAVEHNSKAALKSPPHITLHMPFKLKLEREDNLGKVLQEAASGHEAFKVELRDYGQFNERTIFIDIVENAQLHALFKSIMRSMKINFNIFNADYKNRGYNPHMTLAFRDLKRDEFKRAWPDIKDKTYHQHFTATSFTLLKHNGKHWEVFREMSLGS
ncbi:MAG: 2'-5' RNA ligase family protein [Fulvivirga sp.]